MRAAVLTSYRKIEVGEIPEPAIGPNDLLVKVMACGLCPTDYRLYAGISTFRKPPMTLGHEPAGVVVKVGSEVKDIVVGDKVAGDTVMRCGHCKACLEGRENLCSNRKRMSDGALAEFVAVNQNYVNKFSKASFDEAALSEPLSCVLNGANNSRIRLGHTVVIVGSGQIGLMHMQVAKLLGARTIMVDLRPERLEFAKRLGSDYTIDSSIEDPLLRVNEITEGKGADRAIVAIGNSVAIETALKLVGIMGSVNIFASTNPPTKIAIDPNLIHHHETSLIGSFDKTRDDLRLATKLIDEGRIDVKSLITHKLDLEDSEKAFQLLGASTGVKILVRPNKE